MNQSVIVIGGGNHHNALGVIRALGRRGYGVELITVDDPKRNYIATSRYVSKHHALASTEELAAYLLFRKESGTKEVIISCADAVTEHLNKHLNRLSGRYAIPGVAEQGRMVQLMDKTVMIGMAARHGIHAPEVWHLPEDYGKVTYPCITKAFVSSHGGKQDIVICQTQQELDGFLEGNEDSVFAQRFVRKKEEVQFIGCSLYGGQSHYPWHDKKVLRSQPNSNTGFLEYGPVEPFWQDTEERAKAYIKDCGYSGLFSIEFLRGEDDKVYFLEINFRNDGNSICVTDAGINLPVVWARACLGEDYMDEIRIPRKIVVMPEFQDFKQVLQRRVGLIQWLHDLRRTDTFVNYAKDDMRPFFQFIINKLKIHDKEIFDSSGRCLSNDGQDEMGGVFDLLDHYGVRPMVGIIPHNEDPKQKIDAPDADFWQKAQQWQKKGYAIAMHGYDHCYISDKGLEGLNPLGTVEFAGVPLDVQRQKMADGYSIMKSHGVTPHYFFAPSHTYDANTLRALKECTGIRIISDTIATRPYRQGDFIFLPQLGGHCMEMKLPGIWTFCLHPSAMTEDNFRHTELFLKAHQAEFASFDALPLDNLKGKDMLGILLSWAYFSKRRLKGTK